MSSWSNYATFAHNIFTSCINSEIGSEVIEQSGVLSFWTIQSLKIAESQDEIPLDDRITSLQFIVEVWLERTQFIDNQIQGTSQGILNILKRAARDVKQTLTTIAIELLFRLLEAFAIMRHKFAPTIYKTLTFILVEFYWEVEPRDLVIRHFIYLFKKLETIPIAILCEPLLKQVQIS